MSELLNDKRFAFIARDPKFKRIPKTERKVKIDKRFQSMFNDKKFTVQYTIDKRGRPVNQTSSENLRKYYDLSSSEDEDEAEDEKEHEKPKQRKKNKSKHYKKKENKVNTVSDLNENSPEDNMNINEDTNSSDDNYFSSNGELLRIKPKEECNIDSEDSESASDTDYTALNNLKADIKESKRQLNIRNKYESDKLSSKIKEKLSDLSINYARGEGVLITDSSSDEESSEASGNT